MAGGDWTAVATDDSSPVYSAKDDVSGLDDGTKVAYRAAMTGPGFSVVSETRTVTVGEAPQPDSVTVAGSLNQAMGCTNPWDPACSRAMMVLDPADKVWRLTVDLPEGQYEYKAALNGGWDENYGAGGAFNGPNITLDHPGGPVTFRYDNSTHLLSAVYASQQPGAVAAAGSMNSELGCAADWEPACDQAQLVLDPADLVWKLSASALSAGTYEFKAALDRSWNVSYGAGGASPGSNIVFKHDGGPATFRYDHFTHVITAG